MSIEIKCQCCGKREDILSGQLTPPPGWRSIHTVIISDEEGGSYRPDSGERSHSCPDCNSYMSVEEHFEAEYLNRNSKMSEEIAKKEAAKKAKQVGWLNPKSRLENVIPRRFCYLDEKERSTSLDRFTIPVFIMEVPDAD